MMEVKKRGDPRARSRARGRARLLGLIRERRKRVPGASRVASGADALLVETRTEGRIFRRGARRARVKEERGGARVRRRDAINFLVTRERRRPASRFARERRTARRRGRGVHKSVSRVERRNRETDARETAGENPGDESRAPIRHPQPIGGRSGQNLNMDERPLEWRAVRDRFPTRHGHPTAQSLAPRRLDRAPMAGRRGDGFRGRRTASDGSGAGARRALRGSPHLGPAFLARVPALYGPASSPRGSRTRPRDARACSRKRSPPRTRALFSRAEGRTRADRLARARVLRCAARVATGPFAVARAPPESRPCPLPSRLPDLASCALTFHPSPLISSFATGQGSGVTYEGLTLHEPGAFHKAWAYGLGGLSWFWVFYRFYKDGDTLIYGHAPHFEHDDDDDHH